MHNTPKNSGLFHTDKPFIISDEYKKEAALELLGINLRREKILSIALVLIVAALFFLDAACTKAWTEDTHIFLKLSGYHLALLLIPAFFLLLGYTNWMISLGQLTERELLICRIMHTSLNMSVLIICALISVENFRNRQFPFSYIIAVFCIASLIYLSTWERYTMFFISFGICIAGLARSGIDDLEFIGNLFFISLLIILAIIVSGINYNAQVNSLIGSSQLEHKNRELADMYNILDEALERSTDELSREMEYKRLRTLFFANMSHELRTPITVISTAVQMLNLLTVGLETGEKKEKIHRYLDTIRQNCYRLTRLASNLIDITKIDAGEFRLDLKNLNIVKVVEDISLSAAKYLENRDLHILFDTEVEEAVIACDPDKIERIVLNLLSNAVKFTPAGGNIYIDITDREEMLDIHVRDTGIGIPPEMHEHIFQRFIQVETSTTRSREGSGVGLSIVKSLVELHNGTITLVSEQGKGSEFIVSIPKTRCDSDEAMPEDSIAAEKQRMEKVRIEFSDIYF